MAASIATIPGPLRPAANCVNGGDLINDLQLVPLHHWWQRPALLALLVSAAIAFLGVLLWAYLRWKTQPPPSPPMPMETDWAAEFQRRLAELRSRSGQMDAYLLAIETSRLIREFLAHAQRWHATCQTSRELLALALAIPGLEAPLRHRFESFLILADRIKFEQHGALPRERAQLLDDAENLILNWIKPTSSKPTL